MNTQQLQVKEMLEEIIKDPADFAKNAHELPPQLVHQLHTLLITTILITLKQQGGIVDQLVAILNAMNTPQQETPTE